MSSNMIGSAIPTIRGGMGGKISKIIKVIKTLFGLFKKPSKDAGETDSVNDNSSLENIDRIMQIFSDFKEQVHARAVEVEAAVVDEINYYAEELHIILEQTDNVSKYSIHTKRIERQIDRMASRVKGTIDHELAKKVSLDDPQCKKMVKMIPGAKKEAAMNEFFNTAVTDALDSCCMELQSTLGEIYDDVEIEIVGAIDAIQKQNEHLMESFSSIDEKDYEATAQRQIADAYYLIEICDRVLEML